jgi:CRISPR-associated endoribonuclease Cas6
LRIKVTFKTNKLPILYRHRFMALIKEALRKSDPDYKNELYPDKDTMFSKIVKPFSFSISMPQERTIKREKFLVDDGVPTEDIVFYFPESSFLAFNVSSSDYQFIVNLYNGLLETKEFNLSSDIKLKLDRVFMMNEKKINSNEVIFRTNSPISIESKDGMPILPPIGEDVADLDRFNEHFNAIHSRIIKSIRGDNQDLFMPLEFTPIKLKKQVVKHTLKGFREKTGKPYMTLTCFEGCFKLKGDQRDLQLLYQIGIGLRTGQGFGMVEVV